MNILNIINEMEDKDIKKQKRKSSGLKEIIIPDEDNKNLEEKKEENDFDNNWSINNTKTVKKWKGALFKSIYIYRITLDKNKLILNKLLIRVLILSILATLISAISSVALTITNNQTYIWIALALNILNIILNASTTLINGKIKIYKFDEVVSSITLFIEKANLLYSIITSMLVLPPKLREDAIGFIKNQNHAFLTLWHQTPELNDIDLEYGNNKFVEFVNNKKNSSRLLEKFYSNKNVIEIN